MQRKICATIKPDLFTESLELAWTPHDPKRLRVNATCETHAASMSGGEAESTSSPVQRLAIKARPFPKPVDLAQPTWETEMCTDCKTPAASMTDSDRNLK